MKEYNMHEAKTKFSKICRPPEEKKEDAVIISRNGKPVLKVALSDSSPRQKLFGAGKGSRNSVYKCPKHTAPGIFFSVNVSEKYRGKGTHKKFTVSKLFV